MRDQFELANFSQKSSKLVWRRAHTHMLACERVVWLAPQWTAILKNLQLTTRNNNNARANSFARKTQ